MLVAVGGQTEAEPDAQDAQVGMRVEQAPERLPQPQPLVVDLVLERREAGDRHAVVRNRPHARELARQAVLEHPHVGRADLPVAVGEHRARRRHDVREPQHRLHAGAHVAALRAPVRAVERVRSRHHGDVVVVVPHQPDARLPQPLRDLLHLGRGEAVDVDDVAAQQRLEGHAATRLVADHLMPAVARDLLQRHVRAVGGVDGRHCAQGADAHEAVPLSG